jgi:hypothetical protein
VRGRLFARVAFPSALSAVPQLPQNFARRAFSKPQLGQLFLSRAPHAVQNASPSGFSEPQLGQHMLLLYSFGCSGARKTPESSQSGGNLLLRARGPWHPIDIRRTGIHGRQQLGSLESAERRLGYLQHLLEQHSGVLGQRETLGGQVG